MPEYGSDNPGPDANVSGASSFPVGDSGWMAGDFQNGSGLLGLVAPGYAPSSSTIGASSALPSSASSGGAQSSGPFALGDTGWLAGDFQNGSGLFGLVPPAGTGAVDLSQGSTVGAGGTPDAGASPGQTDNDASANSGGSPSDGESPDDSGSAGAGSEGDDATADETSPPLGGDNGLQFDGQSPNGDNAHLDYGLATPGEAGLIPLAANRTLKRQWSIRENRDWPVTEDGRSYHAHHKVAVADGGAKTLDNIEPMHPDEHLAHHQANGDFSRWAKQGWANQRAAAATSQPTSEAPAPPGVKPPAIPEEIPPEAPEPGVGALGLLGLIPMATGLLSGRIRHDTFDNFMSDMIGTPSQQDITKRRYEIEKLCNPNAKMGDVSECT